MKIIHTADWHIGKMLHKHSLASELQYFFNWLIEMIILKEVNLLLVSGDIFDIANPGAKDREMYFQFLKALIGTNTKVIITGGNHDSVGFLNAPKDVLNMLDIDIIGGATEQIEDELIVINNHNNLPQLVVAAVPFLRDKDLRNLDSDEKFTSREEAIRQAIKSHYQKLVKICNEKYPHIPKIAMGHLYTIGADPSDSEREIHVGNAGAVKSDAFAGFDYVALGHIHRPQVIGKNEMVRYSGSPISLSFSEKNDQKSIVCLEIKDQKIAPPEVILIPKQRELKKFKGSLSDVKSNLVKYAPKFNLPSFVELEVIESHFNSLVVSEVDAIDDDSIDNKNYVILKRRIQFLDRAKDTSHLFTSGENIEDLSPMDVFREKLNAEKIEESVQKELIQAYQEILETVRHSD